MPGALLHTNFFCVLQLVPGKSVYFWALVSALGTFWLGAGVSMRHSIEELINPTVSLDKVCCSICNMHVVAPCPRGLTVFVQDRDDIAGPVKYHYLA